MGKITKITKTKTTPPGVPSHPLHPTPMPKTGWDRVAEEQAQIKRNNKHARGK